LSRAHPIAQGAKATKKPGAKAPGLLAARRSQEMAARFERATLPGNAKMKTE